MKQIQRCFIGVFLLFIAVIGFCTLDNDIATNPDEMRDYSRFPEMGSYSDVVDVEFLNKIDSAFSDQLEWRDSMVKSYYNLQVNVMNQSYVGSVVIGKDNVLFNGPIDVKNWNSYKKNIKKGAELINDVADKAKQYGTKLIVLDIPRRDISMSEYLPSYYPKLGDKYDECLDVQKEALSDDVYLIDAKELFEKNNTTGENLYWYYNDHHINATGNDLILSEIIKIVNKDYPDVKQKTLDDYEIENTQVYGALNRKIGLAASAPDEILWLEPDGWKVDYTRIDNGKESKKGVLNRVDEHGQRTYSVTYMGNNFGETVVETDNDDKMPSIFYCGSSFSNALESLSVPSFKNMYSVDFRYNSTSNTLEDYIEKWKPEYVVLISGQSTATFNLKHLKTHLGINKNNIDLD